jgi:hypothetical protein
MTSDSWIGLDEYRSSWLILLLGDENWGGAETDAGVENEKVTYWELGVANADSVVGTSTEILGQGEVQSERTLLEGLLAKINQYRYEETLVITPVDQTVRRLRRRLATTCTAGEGPSLRGFTQVGLAEVLDEYFGQSLAEYGIDRQSLSGPRITSEASEQAVTTGDVERVWNAWTTIYSLVPPHQLTGEQM